MASYLSRHRSELLFAAMALGLFAAIAILVLGGNRRTVTHNYELAANQWRAGQPIYSESGHGFLYLPYAALIYVPFSALPEPLGELLWRAVGLAMLTVGTFRFCRLLPVSWEHTRLSAGFITLLLCAESLRNGQATVLMTASMLLGAEAVARSRWSLATVFLLAGFALKPLSLPLLLLVFAIYRPIRARLIVAGCLLMIVPYAFQSPSYVTQQYQELSQMLRSAYQLGNDTWWAQLFGMLRAFAWHTPPVVQTACRVVAAATTLVLCWSAHRQIPTRRFEIWLYTLAAIYLMLFNPRTENCTYCVLGPAIGLFYAEALANRRFLAAGTLLCLSLTIAGSYEMGRLLMPHIEPIWLAPLGCLGFAGIVLTRLAIEFRPVVRGREAAHIRLGQV